MKRWNAINKNNPGFSGSPIAHRQCGSKCLVFCDQKIKTLLGCENKMSQNTIVKLHHILRLFIISFYRLSFSVQGVQEKMSLIKLFSIRDIFSFNGDSICATLINMWNLSVTYILAYFFQRNCFNSNNSFLCRKLEFSWNEIRLEISQFVN